jgi:hypothetical protein
VARVVIGQPVAVSFTGTIQFDGSARTESSTDTITDGRDLKTRGSH